MQHYCSAIFDNVLLNRSLYILELENWIAQIEPFFPTLSNNRSAQRSQICKSLLTETERRATKKYEIWTTITENGFLWQAQNWVWFLIVVLTSAKFSRASNYNIVGETHFKLISRDGQASGRFASPELKCFPFLCAIQNSLTNI